MSDDDWWKSAVIYQIYPRSFADSDGDGVGDLTGIIGKLGYLAALPVDAIWLSPIYPSPMADFGYDVADYCGVHPLFGTLDDFDALTAAAHRHGIKVIVDWVPCHTSDQHPWFVESRSSRDNPKRDWYVWRDPRPDGGPPNNWFSGFRAVGGAWTLDETAGQYYLHSFMREQPDLNWHNPEVQQAMYDVLRFWLARGVDGFRIDVAHRIGKDPLLRNNDATQRYDENWPSGHDRLHEARAVAEEYGAKLLVGEVYVLDQNKLLTYVNSGGELHLAHNFVFVRQPWSAAAFRAVVDEWHALASAAAWPNWFLENHDHPRVASRYDDSGNGERRARLALMMVLTLRGTPFLFQGQELGLPDVPIPPDRVVDVDGRDPERAPIPWLSPSSAGPGAGFTAGRPWLPISPDAQRLSVDAQFADDASTLTLTQRLLALRRKFPALTTGGYRSVDLAADVFAFERSNSDERILVLLNFADEANPPLDLSGLTTDAPDLLLSTVADRSAGPVEARSVRLEGDEGAILRLRL